MVVMVLMFEMVGKVGMVERVRIIGGLERF